VSIQEALGFEKPTYKCFGDWTDIACVQCKTHFHLSVSQQQIDTWKAGALIQRAMPNLSDGDRELFLSGYCDNCFRGIFADSEEDS
jgi:hypothetical protein